jgi:hypothetical protein
VAVIVHVPFFRYLTTVPLTVQTLRSEGVSDTASPDDADGAGAMLLVPPFLALESDHVNEIA